jgi:hypothetical protein
VKRIAWVALLAAAAACGRPAEPLPGPLDSFHFPTGVAVARSGLLADSRHRLLVASSNADLLFDDETGGAVVALDPGQDPVRRTGGVNVLSFAGDLAIVDPEVCVSVAEPLALFATRGSNTLNVLRIGPDGGLSCDAGRCGIPLSGPFADPFAIGVACKAERARAFVGNLRAQSGQAWISEYDLAPESGVPSPVRSFSIGVGPARGFAYDAARDRLYIAGLATGTPTPLRWIELGGGCDVALPASAGGCTVGQAPLPISGSGLELRSIALSSDVPDPSRRRAYLTGRVYDLTLAAAAGGRTTDFGGKLLVVDLVENPFGGIDVELVDEVDIGRGAQDVRVLPRGTGLHDVVVAVASDDGVLWLYEDVTRARRAFPRDPGTGDPALGDAPSGIAVDPDATTTARVYVAAYRSNFVTPVIVPLDSASPVDAAFIPTVAPEGKPRKITGGTP